MSISDQEKGILRLWRERQVFEKSVERRPKNRSFVFYEGPPTANGKPAIHHVLARAYKDVICRWKTMRGFRVERKGGWDTHGLPVEIEVEKQLGLKNKRDIEGYGIAAFNEKCRESVWAYKKNWEDLTERMGYWVDLERPYITYDPLYMESLWWAIKQAWEKKLLYKGHKILPMCPRCGTGLSSHEVAQGYEDVSEDSVFVKFKIKNAKGKTATKNSKKARSSQLAARSYFLAWTTTPWTLPGNVALAVGADIDYALVEQNGEQYILAKERLGILEGGYKILKTFKGKELVGMEYEPVFDSLKDTKEKKHYVAVADFVSIEDGTGIVHTAVMYGEDDYQLGEKLGLPKVHTVNEDGTFNERVGQWKGVFVKNADQSIIADLETRGLLYKVERYTHSYPFCWRCKTPLLYYAMDSWFIAMSKLRAKLIAANKKVKWVPSHIRDGRFGEWLREAKDWAFSRARYWGTPLPIWECAECGRREVIGSRDDLHKQKFSTNTYYLLRHGFSKRNQEHTISSLYPEPDPAHILPKGKVQAKAAAVELKKMGGVDMVFASPFTRTQETAEIVGKALGVPVQTSKELYEAQTGECEGWPEARFHREYPTMSRFTRAPKRGETVVQIMQRMRAFIEKIEKKYQGKRILIVSHGDPIWALEGTMTGRTWEELARIKDEGKEYPPCGEVRPLHFAPFPYNEKGELDLHRPYVDEITFFCSKCSAKNPTMKRIKEIADVWFDSGAMPFAQYHFPFTENAPLKVNSYKLKAELYPADYIAEAIDQTRGWFYTLLAVSTFLGYGVPYKHVVSLSHVLDKHGKKMSKSRGNVVDPWAIVETYGADALRWYFYTVNDAGDSKLFDEKDVKERYNKFVGTLGNVLTFYKTYASDSGKLKAISYKLKARHVLDKWIIAKWEQVKEQAINAMEAYDVPRAARALDAFAMEDLSNWYVRRSRRRFQRPQNAKEKKEAQATLQRILWELAHYTAPFTPFLAEHIFQELARGKTSVHWQDLPRAHKLLSAEKKTMKDMEHVRAIVKEGLRLRMDAGIRVRQPLQTLITGTKLSSEYHEIIKEELNIKEVVLKAISYKLKAGFVLGESDGKKIGLDTTLTPALLREGLVREMVRHIQDLRKAAGMKPQDVIEVHYDGENIGEQWERFLAGETNARSVERGMREEQYDGQGVFAWEGKDIRMGIRRSKGR